MSKNAAEIFFLFLSFKQFDFAFCGHLLNIWRIENGGIFFSFHHPALFCLIHRYNIIEIKTEELCSKGIVTTYKLRVGGLGQPRFIGVLKRSSKKRSKFCESSTPKIFLIFTNSLWFLLEFLIVLACDKQNLREYRLYIIIKYIS